MTQASCLIGLLGHGIQGSLAPPLHMREGAALGIHYVYRLVDFATLGFDHRNLGEVIAYAERLGFDGLAVTHPYKQAVIPLLSGLSDEARALEAVNTVVLRGGTRIGHNTDWLGFADAFRRNFPGAETGSVVQMGAGGAGAAVAYAMLTLGAGQLVVFDVDAGRAAQLVERMRGKFGRERVAIGTDLEPELQTADGLINTTPVGMEGHPGSPVPEALLRPDLWLADIIYFPSETALLRAARALGARTMNGGGMMVIQAAEQIRLFTGQLPSYDRMLAFFDEIRRDKQK